MIEVRFHSSLYDAEAVTEAIDVYADFARFERVGGDAAAPYIHVRIEASADGEISEEDVRAEFANYALGRTIERRDGREVAS